MHHLSAKIWSWRNNDGDGFENFTWKVKPRCFKLYRAYSISFHSLKCWLLGMNSKRPYIEVQEKKKKVVVLLILYSPCTKLLFKSSQKCRLQDVCFFSLLSYCTRNPCTRAAINEGVSPSPKSSLLLAIALAGILREKGGLQAVYRKCSLCGKR